ncbi:MAG: M48 family metallopeptidase [Treponema sp.]|nr:M48 family metallopeptidase [Treponema sp.]
MKLPENYIVERRNVKHTRLIITEDCKVLLYVPLSTEDKDIELILSKRQLWIEKKLSFFRNRKKIELARNEILLFGKPFTYIYDSKCRGKVQINFDSKVITTKKQLLDKTVQERWYKAYAKEYMTDRINFLSSALNLKYNQLFIRTQRTKWGNCTADKNISLNWKLIKCPDYVIDYVCTHELCHTKIMNHGVQFKTLLNSLCPNVDKAQKWLTDYGYCL